MALFWSSLLTFYTRRQNGLLHVSDKAATAGNFATTAAGSLSTSIFTSARRHRRLPSSDLKQANSSCAQPPPTPLGLLRGICPPCQSRGWGIWQPRGQPRAFDTHAVSYQNITTQRILLEKQADWLICQGREKIEEICRGMFSILSMHFFIAYQARST